MRTSWTVVVEYVGTDFGSEPQYTVAQAVAGEAAGTVEAVAAGPMAKRPEASIAVANPSFLWRIALTGFPLYAYAGPWFSGPLTSTNPHVNRCKGLA